MTTRDEALAAAGCLPEVTVADHHGMDSFRIRGRIFATVPDDDHIRIMLDELDTNAAVGEYPQACAPFFWGSRLACVQVTLAAADLELVRELLIEAWRRKAPKRLVAELDRSSE